MKRLLAGLVVAAALSAPAIAKDRLGIYQSWVAFRDPGTRCYAIAEPEDMVGTATQSGYLSVAFWPKQRITHQVYVRLSRVRSANSGITLNAGGRRFRLTARGSEGWAPDRASDQVIVAAIRSAASLSVESLGRDGRAIVDTYALRGAPSAIDAAALGCSKS